MLQNNCDPAPTRVDAALRDAACPKCGVEMEPIDSAAEGLAVEQLQLCPGCYLVTWIDHNQYHLRQGVAMKRGFHFGGDPEWLVVHPEEC